MTIPVRSGEQGGGRYFKVNNRSRKILSFQTVKEVYSVRTEASLLLHM